MHVDEVAVCSDFNQSEFKLYEKKPLDNTQHQIYVGQDHPGEAVYFRYPLQFNPTHLKGRVT